MMSRIAVLTALTLLLVPTVGRSQADTRQGGQQAHDNGEKGDGRTDGKMLKGGGVNGKGKELTPEEMKA
jgi:hypothetical protein